PIQLAPPATSFYRALPRSVITGRPFTRLRSSTDRRGTILGFGPTAVGSTVLIVTGIGTIRPIGGRIGGLGGGPIAIAGGDVVSASLEHWHRVTSGDTGMATQLAITQRSQACV